MFRTGFYHNNLSIQFIRWSPRCISIQIVLSRMNYVIMKSSPLVIKCNNPLVHCIIFGRLLVAPSILSIDTMYITFMVPSQSIITSGLVHSALISCSVMLFIWYSILNKLFNFLKWKLLLELMLLNSSSIFDIWTWVLLLYARSYNLIPPPTSSDWVNLRTRIHRLVVYHKYRNWAAQCQKYSDHISVSVVYHYLLHNGPL